MQTSIDRSTRGRSQFRQPSPRRGERKSARSPRRFIPRQVSKHVSAVLGSSGGKKLANCFFRIETKPVFAPCQDFFRGSARRILLSNSAACRRRWATQGCNSSLIRRKACQRVAAPPGVDIASINRRFASINARTCGFSFSRGKKSLGMVHEFAILPPPGLAGKFGRRRPGNRQMERGGNHHDRRGGQAEKPLEEEVGHLIVLGAADAVEKRDRPAPAAPKGSSARPGSGFSPPSPAIGPVARPPRPRPPRPTRQGGCPILDDRRGPPRPHQAGQRDAFARAARRSRSKAGPPATARRQPDRGPAAPAPRIRCTRRYSPNATLYASRSCGKRAST